MFLTFEKVADEVWEACVKFNWFAKATVGKQAVRAADSICANLVEGDGRYSEAEAIHFFHIARGSARELRFWIRRCERRRLIKHDHAESLIEQIHHGARMINQLINFRRESRAKTVREQRASYGEVHLDDPFLELLD